MEMERQTDLSLNSNGVVEHRILKGLTCRDAEDSLEFDGWDKPWIERIAPGAFTRSLEENPDVKALWSHRDDSILARAPDTLSIKEDDKGLRVDIKLIDTQQNRDVLSSVRGGLVDAMSFGFQARKTEWEDTDEREIRTLLDVDLFEVSPVVWPAYPATSIKTQRSARGTVSGNEERDAIKAERDQYFEAKAQAEENSLAELRIWEQRNRFIKQAPQLIS
jgi:HK97 family phage prohead protease